MDFLVRLMKQLSQRTIRQYHVLDLFGASQRISKTWENAGYNPVCYDIKVHPTHDICCEQGFARLLGMAMQFHVTDVSAFFMSFCV